MPSDNAFLFVRKWWFLGLALLGLGGWATGLQGSISSKADKSDVAEIRRDIAEIKSTLQDMNARQREYFCQNKPAWCR